MVYYRTLDKDVWKSWF